MGAFAPTDRVSRWNSTPKGALAAGSTRRDPLGQTETRSAPFLPLLRSLQARVIQVGPKSLRAVGGIGLLEILADDGFRCFLWRDPVNLGPRTARSVAIAAPNSTTATVFQRLAAYQTITSYGHSS